MTDEVSGVASQAAELEAVLLDAKLSVPTPRQDSVSRADLVLRARSSESRIVAVTAPAGYGKSTLLAEWAELEDRPVAWVSLDRFDDDPSVLLSVLAHALARITGPSGLVADMRGVGISTLGRAAPLLASAFHSSPTPFVLILDDLHEIRSADCHDVLSVVISGIPRGSQLLTASRSEQPHVPRLRAAGEVVEVVASDLALNADGATQIFARAHQHLTPQLAEAVTARTEGWPVGLYLASIIAGDGGHEAANISGEDRYVADYLYRESLSQLPEEVRAFLRRTAILDQVSGPLCDALLESCGAQAQLRQLEATNLFLVPLDRRRGWYRYHALFREFLLGELRRVEPDITEKLHLRAADWYESNGSPVLALEHLLNTTQRDRSIQAVTALAMSTYQSGHVSTVQRWFSALGRTALHEYPPLAVLAGWAAVLTGQTTEALRWAAFVDTASFDLAPADGTASFDSSRALLRALMCRDGVDQMMRDASFAEAAEPPWGAWRASALVLSAEAYLLRGDEQQAAALFVETSSVAESQGSVGSFILAHAELAVLAMNHGRWPEAAEHVDRALATIDEFRMPDHAMSVLALAASARLAVQRGDRRGLDGQLTRAMRSRLSCTLALPYVAVRARLQLARVHAAIADHAGASHLLREVDDILLHRPDLGTLVDEAATLRQILTANPHEAVVGGAPLTVAELRLLPYLQTHLTFREIGERLFVSRNTVSSEVGSIYRKLGVSSRSDAVDRATTLGLIGGL